MQYQSTRDPAVTVSAARAIAQGISPEGGLFVPGPLPVWDGDRIRSLTDLSYTDRACRVLADFLTGFTPAEVADCVTAAYGSGFDHPDVAPVKKLNRDTYLLELWHGPTCAFKDMALQLLPHLLTRSLDRAAEGRQAAILVATSGDTGKAALEGFRDVPGTKILAFYPSGGVSEMQKLQMTTQEGGNVGVCGVNGNFDDTQTAVKKMFTDPEMQQRLAAKGMLFTSANSINWGRLAPQIVYYFSAYADLVKTGEITCGEPVNVAVPTGNFGNILAAYYAKQMGLPVAKLICASNINNVLTDFIRTGTYDRRRAFHMTASPSMDILISSNLERLLHALYSGHSAAPKQDVAELMASLSGTGVYTVSGDVKNSLQESFYGGFCDERETADTVRETFVDFQYLLDTHTAVAVSVREQYQRDTGDGTKTIVASTANPYKFAGSILSALRGVDSDGDAFAQAEQLSVLTKTPIPPQLLTLRDKAVRFPAVLDKGDMSGWTAEMLGV